MRRNLLAMVTKDITLPWFKDPFLAKKQFTPVRRANRRPVELESDIPPVIGR
jgi:hypothetical protein